MVAAGGLAAAGHDVLGVEINSEWVDLLRRGKIPFYEPGLAEWVESGLQSSTLRFLHRDEVTEDPGEVAVVAVGTPPSEESAADLRQVRAAVSWVKSMAPGDLVIAMKSTVPPGTGLKLMEQDLAGTSIGYAANPEFLREGNAISDWDRPDRIIIGAIADDLRSVKALKRLHAGINAPLMVTDITSAEMVKYATNAFLATRISFINEIAALCRSLGASIDDVSRGLALDSRTGALIHAGVGYGGSCLPKDIGGLDHLARNSGNDLDLLRAVEKVNDRQRRLPLYVLRKRFNGNLTGLRVCVLGLAFKPGTDDVRDAPALDLIRTLAAEGAVVTAFDPLANGTARQQLPSQVQLFEGVAETAEGMQALCLMTEWDEIVAADWEAIARRMHPPRFIFDGRNALDSGEMYRLGFEYVGVGRSISHGTNPAEDILPDKGSSVGVGRHGDR